MAENVDRDDRGDPAPVPGFARPAAALRDLHRSRAASCRVEPERPMSLSTKCGTAPQ